MTDESDQRSYRLISGEFSTDEAREVLMTLIEDKIGFHERNNWSRREHQLDTDDGEKRIAALRQTKADIIALLESANEAGKKLSINCNIEISLEQM
jgi:hypothetical protein